MTVEFRVRKDNVAIANTSTKLLTHVRWWVSHWDAEGDPSSSRYWNAPQIGKGYMPALHAGEFGTGSTLPPGSYRVEINFATPDGESHQEVQHLIVDP